MSLTTTATENPEVRELIDRGLKLSRARRPVLLDSAEAPPLDPETILRRIADFEPGRPVALAPREWRLWNAGVECDTMIDLKTTAGLEIMDVFFGERKEKLPPTQEAR